MTDTDRSARPVNIALSRRPVRYLRNRRRCALFTFAQSCSKLHARFAGLDSAQHRGAEILAHVSGRPTMKGSVIDKMRRLLGSKYPSKGRRSSASLLENDFSV